VADASNELNELEGVQVSLILTLDDKTKSVMTPRTAGVYDEQQQNLGYTRCVRLKGLHDPFLGRDSDGHLQLQHWTSYVTKVVLYAPEGGQPLELGASGQVGLTSETPDTATKKLDALVATPIAPFTEAGLKALGL
jgi:hypothetical protein